MGSAKFKINKDDLVKVLKNSALVGAAAGVTYLSANFTKIDMGLYGAMFVPIISTALDTVIKWLKDNTN